MLKLSGAAQAVIEDGVMNEGVNTYGIEYSETGLLAFAGECLKMPSDSMWSDEELWRTHTLMFDTPARELTDDYLYGTVNLDVAAELLTRLYPDDVSVDYFGSWTYSRFECLRVRVIDEDNQITAAFAHAYLLARCLEEYPLLDEELYWERENEIQYEDVKMWCEVWHADYDAFVDLWRDDVISVDGIGSSFSISSGIGKELPYGRQDQALADFVNAHAKTGGNV